MKKCTKCKVEYEATLEKFPSNAKAKDGLGSWCKVCVRELNRASYSKNRDRRLAQKREYGATLNGHLRRVYKNMNRRCSGQSGNHKDQSYSTKGVKNKFVNYYDFYDWVIRIMCEDPRGKQIHRIDNDGHYEPGNIEFLTPEEHKDKHKIRRH